MAALAFWSVSNLHYFSSRSRNTFSASKCHIAQDFAANLASLHSTYIDDPHLTKKSPYRKVFKTRSNVKQVVPFSNPRTDLWIQDVLRLTFLQDTALLHCANYTVDDALKALARKNERSVINEILNEDRTFLTKVFKIAQDPAEPQRRRNDTVKFVYQLFAMGDRIGTSVCRYEGNRRTVLDTMEKGFDDRQLTIFVYVIPVRFHSTPTTAHFSALVFSRCWSMLSLLLTLASALSGWKFF